MGNSNLTNYAPAWLRALRPAQWLKNAVVPAAWFFARWDPGQSAHTQGIKPLVVTVLATMSFCALSSGVYLINDIHDIVADRLHPIKRRRPIAAGELKISVAYVMAAILLAGGCGALLLLRLVPPAFGIIATTYLVMQLCYTFALKSTPYVDVFVIAIGFVMRATAGAAALAVRISPWLLLCTFLLALFLALCKRRHEKVLLEQDGVEHRIALKGYDPHVLDMQIALTAGATLVCYAIYTLSEETIQRFGTNLLGLTIPLVAFGIFRYLELVFRHEEGGRPERVLLTDKTLMATVICYILTALGVFLTA